MAGSACPGWATEGNRATANLTHVEIAKRGGTSRTRVTAILNDDLQHVSSDLLIRILPSMGYRVKVSVVRSDTAA
jgi:predicted XRE-type DNA-binding protein